MTEGELVNLVEMLEARVHEAGQGVQACRRAPRRAARAALERRLDELSDTYVRILTLYAGQVAGVTKAACEIVAQIDREAEIARKKLEDSDNPEAGASDLPALSTAPRSLRVA
ncbi:MAG: hypothetical protein ACLPKT_24980 [Methylocella sp.]